MDLLNHDLRFKLRSRKGILSFILVLFLAGAIVWATMGYARASYFDYSDSLGAERLFYTSQDIKHSYINNIRFGFEDGNNEYKKQVIDKTRCIFEKAGEELGEDALTILLTGGGSEILDIVTDEDDCSKCLGMAFPTMMASGVSGMSCIWIENIKRCSEKCDCGEFPDYEQVVRGEIDRRIEKYPYKNGYFGQTAVYNGIDVNLQDTSPYCYRVNFDEGTCTAKLDIGKAQEYYDTCSIGIIVRNPKNNNRIRTKIPVQHYDFQLALSLTNITNMIGAVS
ncbi:hypothetical protein J7J26_04205 [Candidatus Micrarchaeota archaeon]|nr:hypothetical protein [Candidatus Micrarchaeota archaeon]